MFTLGLRKNSPQLGASDSGYAALKEGFGDLDFDTMFFKVGFRVKTAV